MSRALGVANKGSPIPGGGALWTPASPTTGGGVSPHAWHYAGSGALFQDSLLTTPAVADGDPIGGSTNQGSDAHSIIQAVAGAKPTLKLNVVNTVHPVYRCDGGDVLQAAFGGGALAQPNTVIVVAKLTTPVVPNITLCDGAPGRHALYNQGSAWNIYAGTVLAGGASDANWNVWLALFNGAGGQFWHNGVSEAAGNVGAGVMSGLTLAARDTAVDQWPGDIAELLVYSSNLSTADKNQVGQYLATKYGTAWTVIL